jgi:hypothetical protein
LGKYFYIIPVSLNANNESLKFLFNIFFCSARNVYLDVSQKEDEPADEDDSHEQDKMNVTMNPLEKFETTDDQAEPQGTTNQKTLEWDDAYIA